MNSPRVWTEPWQIVPAFCIPWTHLYVSCIAEYLTHSGRCEVELLVCIYIHIHCYNIYCRRSWDKKLPKQHQQHENAYLPQFRSKTLTREAEGGPFQMSNGLPLSLAMSPRRIYYSVRRTMCPRSVSERLEKFNPARRSASFLHFPEYNAHTRAKTVWGTDTGGGGGWGTRRGLAQSPADGGR